MKVVGHKGIVSILATQLKRGNISSGYLFLGETSLGKFTLALEFAKGLLCNNRSNRESVEFSCGVCQSCISFNKNIHPDFLLIKNENRLISIDQIREIRRSISLLPSLSKRKVVVFEEASLLSQEAQNAFLKTLEEPPSYGVFILVSSKNLALTIMSRCIILNFQPIPKEVIFKELIKKGKKEKEASLLAHFSLGRIGKVFSDSFLEQYQDAFSALENIVEMSFKEKVDYIKEKEGQMEKMLFFWLLIFHDILLFKLSPGLILSLPNDYVTQVKNLADKFSENQVVKLIKIIQNSQYYLSINLNPRIVFENLLLKVRPKDEQKNFGQVSHDRKSLSLPSL